ncbi:MAG: hypothetical protein F4087_15970 [Gemmatimonadetes bacterium]|nr:hypothetical protein [Gemmatimonadota bacterium]MYE71284.1 hypothetical protein [Gemmatimonadota bacterium]MYJ69988.1 hypothetical protein [Gemmatimonadota bacterium]
MTFHTGGSNTKRWTKLALTLVGVFALTFASSPALFAQDDDDGECECVDINDDTRPCTASENYDCCLVNAVEAADKRAEDGTGSKLSRFLDFTADVAECAVGYLGDITFK